MSEQAARVLAAGDRPTAMRCAKQLQCTGHEVDAWRIFSTLRRNQWAMTDVAPEWDGEPLEGKTLLVRDPERQIVPLIRMARFLGPACERAGKVIAFTQKRLLAPMRRTFPDADLRAIDDDRPLPHVDFVASYDRLGQHLWREDSFMPLIADGERVAALRGKPNRPRIGIAWHSTNPDKSLPLLEDWARMMNQVDAHFFSLQYHEEDYGYAELQAATGGRLKRFDGIDHFHDIDGHLAAIASTDLLVTISNTTAHAAGCLGHRTLVVLEDDQRNNHWSPAGRKDWFFPSVRLLQQQGRAWPAVMEEAALVI